MDNGVECESASSQIANEVKVKKDEIAGTNFMYLKNCMNNTMEVKDANGEKHTIPKNEYCKFQPKDAVNYGCVYFKKSTGQVKK